MEQKQEKLVLGVRILVMILFAASLFLPVVSIAPDGSGGIPGYLILLLGWLILFGGTISWLANFAFWFALTRRSHNWQRLLVSPFLLLCVIQAAFLWKMVPGETGESRITGHGAGFYVWISAMLFAAVLPFLRPTARRTGI